MLKKERLQWILEKVNVKGIITVNDVIKELGVSDMTVRRDLDELDKDGLLIRIHGGAQSIDSPKIRSKHEKSNTEKQELQIEEKRAIAKFASVSLFKKEKQFLLDQERHSNILQVNSSPKIFELLQTVCLFLTF